MHSGPEQQRNLPGTMLLYSTARAHHFISQVRSGAAEHQVQKCAPVSFAAEISQVGCAPQKPACI